MSLFRCVTADSAVIDFKFGDKPFLMGSDDNFEFYDIYAAPCFSPLAIGQGPHCVSIDVKKTELRFTHRR